ncbi:MAG: hypothetical protein KBC69_01375 [Candidatus Magasanikbacteria bacterium]|nr:hypothetical protein [Candidatus Magasanikbacteria bacterium]
MKNINIHVLTNDPVLQPHKKIIFDTAHKAIRVISKYIPVSDVDIVIEHDLEFGEMSGETHGKYGINIRLNAQSKQFQKHLYMNFLRTLAHELYHTTHAQKVKDGTVLLDEFIEEGLASHFEAEITGAGYSNSFAWLSAVELKRVLKKAKKEFFFKEYSYDDWFYGSKEKKIPQSAGYNIGYFLIMNLLRINPELKPSKLILENRKYVATRVVKSFDL